MGLRQLVTLCISISILCLINIIMVWMYSDNVVGKMVNYRSHTMERTEMATGDTKTVIPLIRLWANVSSSRLLVKSLGANNKINLTSYNKLGNDGKRSTTMQNEFVNESHSLVVTSSSTIADRLVYKSGKSMMTRLCELAQILPNHTDGADFTSNVSSILSKPWKHDVKNIDFFRFLLTKETRNVVYDDMMLTQKHQPTQNEARGRALGLHRKSLLPKPPYRSCSVVGSSGVLLGSKCGSVIDDNDFVIRFNLASISGYEEDVGRKTNITTVNPSILNRYGDLKKANDRLKFAQKKLLDQEGILWMSSADKVLLSKTNDAINLLDDSSLTLVRINRNHFNILGEFWKRYGLNRRQTTGFYFVNCALDLCSEVHLFGFWPFGNSLDGRTIPIHYYDDIELSTYHDASYEVRLLLTMHRLGMLKFHIDDC